MQHSTESHRRRSRTIGYHSSMLLAIIIFALTLTAQANAQWEIQDSHTTAGLRGIDSVGGGVAWASGTNGTILRTEDGGFVWQLCAIPPGAQKLDFRGIKAFDANTAIVMSSGKGDLSRLYKTTDGCQTWKLIFTNPDKEGFWDAMVFNLRKPMYPSADWMAHACGFLVGDPVDGRFVLYSSNDTGQTWHSWANDKSERPAHAAKGESLFAASNEAATIPGNNGNFAFVTGGSVARLCMPQPHSPFDNGTSWSVDCRSIRFPTGKSAGAFAVAGRHADKVYEDLMVVGGDYEHPHNVGDSAFFAGVPRLVLGFRAPVYAQTPPHGFRSAVAYDAQQKLWITVGPNGTDISRDDGRNWTPLIPTKEDAPDADKNWNALSPPFVVGPNGRIGKLRPSALKP